MTASETGSPASQYRPDIDGLRGIAILAVAFYHSGIAGLKNGFTGVDIFFVISGYLIGGQIWSAVRAGTFSYKEFYRRRMKRILPAFYQVLMVAIGAGLVLLSPTELKQLARDATAATLAISNVVFWAKDDYFASRSELNPLLMTWSLGVEEQFYALIPLLLVLVGRVRRNMALPIAGILCLASFAFAWIEAATRPMLAFYMLPARAWELGAGVALAVAEMNGARSLPAGWRRELAGFGGLVLMLASMAVPLPGIFPGRLTWLPVAGAALAIAAPGSWANRRLLSAAPLTYTGRISYSWYLWHWPLLAFLHILYGGAMPPLRAAETVAVSFLLAAISYRLIEQPFRRSALAAPRLLRRYSVASAALLILCAAIWASRGLPRRFPALERMEAAGAVLQSEPCLASLLSSRIGAAAGSLVGRQPCRCPGSRNSRAGGESGLRIGAFQQGFVPAAGRRHSFRSASSIAGGRLRAVQSAGHGDSQG